MTDGDDDAYAHVLGLAILSCKKQKRRCYSPLSRFDRHHNVSRPYDTSYYGADTTIRHCKATCFPATSVLCDAAIKKQDNEGDGSCSACRLQQNDKRTKHFTAAKNGKCRVLQGWRGPIVSRCVFALSLFPLPTTTSYCMWREEMAFFFCCDQSRISTGLSLICISLVRYIRILAAVSLTAEPRRFCAIPME